MKSFFNKRFEEEVLLSEKLRTTILAGMFLFAMLYTFVLIWIVKNDTIKQDQLRPLHLVFTFQFLLFLFQGLTWVHINKKIKTKSLSIPVAARYINSLIEILSPGVIILVLSKQYSVPSTILHAPIAYLYFIFIILSTLRLDFKLTLFTGFFAALSFFLVSLILLNESTTNAGNKMPGNGYIVATAKSMVLLLAGTGAAFVSRQVRMAIDRSLEVAEAGSKVVSMFGQQLSKEVAGEMLKHEGMVQSKTMKVCVMFIDIRNFTEQVADKTPAEIVAYQNAFFEIVINIVTKHNGIINQFLGDGCMVTFGAPVALKNPAQQALQAAIKIQQELNARIMHNKIPQTKIGIGIHVGEAVTGNIGTTERQQYSITGSVVILAARIEQLNKEYHSQILVSEEVMQQVSTAIACETNFLGKIPLKGWHCPVGIYKISPH